MKITRFALATTAVLIAAHIADNPLHAQLAARPNGVRVLRDLSYGKDAAQRLDVYLPPGAQHAPILLMVHGGAWRFGDKAAAAVVENKVARWLPRGFIFASANYRMLPRAKPLDQAKDIARAIAFVQQNATAWGGDPARIVLIGHSAGAHLVALLASDPALAANEGVTPWLGTIALDSAALNVVAIMEAPHARFYDRAFGTDPKDWRAVSPWHRLSGKRAPVLLVCSTERSDSCPQVHAFAQRATSLGDTATELPVALSHREINRNLGRAGGYTDAIENFLHSLGLKF